MKTLEKRIQEGDELIEDDTQTKSDAAFRNRRRYSRNPFDLYTEIMEGP